MSVLLRHIIGYHGAPSAYGDSLTRKREPVGGGQYSFTFS